MTEIPKRSGFDDLVPEQVQKDAREAEDILSHRELAIDNMVDGSGYSFHVARSQQLGSKDPLKAPPVPKIGSGDPFRQQNKKRLRGSKPQPAVQDKIDAVSGGLEAFDMPEDEKALGREEVERAKRQIFGGDKAA